MSRPTRASRPCLITKRSGAAFMFRIVVMMSIAMSSFREPYFLYIFTKTIFTNFRLKLFLMVVRVAAPNLVDYLTYKLDMGNIPI